MSKLNDLVTELNTLSGMKFAAYAWSKEPATGHWGVVQLEFEGSAVHADDVKAEQCIEGSIDLFVRPAANQQGVVDFGETAAQSVQTKLTNLDIPYRLNSIQYEDDRRIVHYEWVISLEGF